MHDGVAVKCLGLVFGVLASAGVVASSPSTDDTREMEALVGPELVQDIVAWDEAADRARADHALELAASEDFTLLLAAAYLAPLQVDGAGSITRDQRATWFTQARTRAPDSALMAWIEANGCHPVLFGAVPCDRAAALERLTRIDPGNAAAWVERLAEANKRGDVMGQDEALVRAAASTHYDTYDVAFGQLLLAGNEGLADRMPSMSSALRRTLDEAAERADAAPLIDLQPEIGALMAWSAHSFGSLQTIFQACKTADGAVVESRREACKALARLAYDDASSAIVRMVATAAMIAFTNGEADNERWLERRRDQRWQQEQVIALMGPVPSVTYIRTALEHGELTAWQLLMDEVDLPLTAPADWQPQYGMGDP